jgi:hypothetical protein
VARSEHGHQLVSQLRVGHRLAFLVAGTKEKGEDVSALAEIGLGASSRDLLVDQPVRRRDASQKPAPRAPGAQVLPQRARQEEHCPGIDHRGERRTKPCHANRLGDPEHRPADHFESQRPHALAKHDLATRRPARNLGLGDVADHIAKCLDGRSLEGWQQQSALAQVLRSVKHQYRVGTEYRGQRSVCLPGVEVRLVAGEQLADGGRVGDVDARSEDEVLDGEDVAVAAAPAQERFERALDQPSRVDGRGRAGTGGERAGAGAAHDARGLASPMMRGRTMGGAFGNSPCSTSETSSPEPEIAASVSRFG